MPNPWAEFRQLFPNAPNLIGTVLETHSDGTVTVHFPDGGTQRVLGTNSVGVTVLVREGIVLSESPSLPTYTLYI
jgi:hypothetical protein